MKESVSQQEIEQYRRDGFLICENFLSEAELEEWRSAVEEAFEARRGFALPGRWERSDEDDHEKIYHQRLNLWMDSERVHKLVGDERIGKMVADLEGIDGVRIWHDQALFKPPFGAPTDWHMDNPYWSFTSEHACSLWVALDDATQDNGCLYFVPGSQKCDASRGNTPIGAKIDALFKLYPEYAKTPTACAKMKAGSASFHNGRTFHGANANMTPGFRRAMTCAYMPDKVTFNGNQNVLPDEVFQKLKIGDPIDDGGLVPVVYRK